MFPSDRAGAVSWLMKEVSHSDLTFINDGNEERLPMPQKPEVKLPNFEKMVLLGQQILELESYRKVRLRPC